jgi:hypothetical protein
MWLAWLVGLQRATGFVHLALKLVEYGALVGTVRAHALQLVDQSLHAGKANGDVFRVRQGQRVPLLWRLRVMVMSVRLGSSSVYPARDDAMSQSAHAAGWCVDRARRVVTVTNLKYAAHRSDADMFCAFSW